jgi:hypothetical protein
MSPWRTIIGIVARGVGAGVATHSARWNSAGRLASISRQPKPKPRHENLNAFRE